MRKLVCLAAIVAALVIGSTASATGYHNNVVVQQIVTPFVPVVQFQAVVVAQPVIVQQQVVAVPVVQTVVAQPVIVQKIVRQKFVRGYCH